MAHALIVLTFASALFCCGDRFDLPLVVYVAFDRSAAEPVLAAFTKETGIAVTPIYDTEAAKTIALARRVMLEKEDPRASVWWSGEALFTARLAKAGCFEEASAWAEERPDRKGRDVRGVHWIGAAARLRVLVFHRDEAKQFATEERPFPPTGMESLSDPWRKNSCIMARPTAGTTATHVVALLQTDQGRELLQRAVQQGLALVDGNAHVVEAVARGQKLLGVTDSDDVFVAQERYPDLRFVPLDIGTVASAAVLRNAPRVEDARRLARFLVSARAEALLARSRAHHVPLSRDVSPPAEFPSSFRLPIESLDPTPLVARWDDAMKSIDELFPR